MNNEINYNQIDPGMRDTIKLLNANGIETTSCCSGIVAEHQNPVNLEQFGYFDFTGYVSFNDTSEYCLKLLANSYSNNYRFHIDANRVAFIETPYGQSFTSTIYQISFPNKDNQNTDKFIQIINDSLNGIIYNEDDYKYVCNLDKKLKCKTNFNILLAKQKEFKEVQFVIRNYYTTADDDYLKENNITLDLSDIANLGVDLENKYGNTGLKIVKRPSHLYIIYDKDTEKYIDEIIDSLI